MLERNSILTGFVIGCLFPVLGFVLVEFIFNTLTHYGLMAEVSASTAGRRFRTIALIALCTNLIPFNYAKNRKSDHTMRGIVFPTLIYVMAWLYKFAGDLFLI
ncbi:MAG: hypothetical protein WAU01_07550 [Saprospiraceae bacterium]